MKALELLSASTELRDKLEENTKYFRAALTERGLTIKPGTHPIVPIMIGDAAKSQQFAARMLEKGVYVIGFFYPVVPHGTARVRTQVSAAHSREDLEFAVNAFAETNAELQVEVFRFCLSEDRSVEYRSSRMKKISRFRSFSVRTVWRGGDRLRASGQSQFPRGAKGDVARSLRAGRFE